jgi:DNA invertase Pin-like site-specific DNA recombinase
VLSAVEALVLQPDGDGWSRLAASFRGMAVHRLQPSAHVKCGITGCVGGRPKALTADDLKKARALLRSGEYTKVQVAKELKVSRHTLWRALAQEAPL